MIPDIQEVQRELEYKFIGDTPGIEKKAQEIYKKDPDMARQFLTRYSVSQAEMTVKRWRELGEFLIYKHLDGNLKNEDGHVTHPGYPEHWYRRIAKEDGERYKMRPLKSEIERNYNGTVAKGDELFKKKEFEKAKEAYQEALTYKADEAHPKNKIAAIDKLLADIEEAIKKIDFIKK
jgi:tetratricopeptide (TPR) repeat protein